MRVFVAGATAREAGTRRFLAQSFGFLYGHGASGNMLDVVRKRQMPVVNGGTGIWSFCEVTDAAAATAAAVTRGAKAPMRAPAWLGRLLGGQLVVSLMTQVRGSANDKAKRELGWAPRYASWRDGFPDWAKTAGQAHAA
jgi:2-alkyl-3-oxoalkanoate reductase